DTRGVAATLNFALRLAVYVSAPATVGLALLSVPITRVLFEHGRFGPDDTAATAVALVWYAVGLVGFAGARIAAQAFYAIAEPGMAVRLGALAVAANVVAAVALMGPLGHAGLAGACGGCCRRVGVVDIIPRALHPRPAAGPCHAALTAGGPTTLMESVAEYLGALQTERGASRNTLAAYRRDLEDFFRYLAAHSL